MSQRIRNSSRSILIVASNSAEVKRFSMLLDNQGYPVKCCSDVESGLVLFKRQHFELVLINVDRVGQCVKDVAAKLKRHSAVLKIVALCGLGNRATINEARTTGLIDAMALKTLDDNDFVSLIENLFGSRAEPKKDLPRIVSRSNTTRALSHPDNSLLHELERRHPGILTGSWCDSDSF